MSKNLNPQKALIFRITHRDNVLWILDNGLHCRNAKTVDPHYVDIGNPELIEKRHQRIVPAPPGGTLSDYVPFYFTPFSPMLYNITIGYGGIRKRGNDEIVIFASSIHALVKSKIQFLFADRHAYLAAAQFYSEIANLDEIDWPLLQQRDFKRDPEDPGKLERYQAEALVYQQLPVAAILGLVCYSDSVASTLKAHLAKRDIAVDVATRPSWYF
jgi:hypothetical protein